MKNEQKKESQPYSFIHVSSFLLSFFLILTSFSLLTVGVEDYCCTWSYSDTPHSVGILCTSDRQVADNTLHSQETDICYLGGIQTRNPSKRATADPYIGPHGHRDRPFVNLWLTERSNPYIYMAIQCRMMNTELEGCCGEWPLPYGRYYGSI